MSGHADELYRRYDDYERLLEVLREKDALIREERRYSEALGVVVDEWSSRALKAEAIVERVRQQCDAADLMADVAGIPAVVKVSRLRGLVGDA